MADDYAGYFAGLEQKYGLPSGYLTGMAQIESRLGQLPDRQGSQYQGMFQLGSDVRNKYGVSDPSNWQQNADGAAQYAADNAKQLSKSLGRTPTASELYLAHQQGAGGAASLILNPDKPAGDVVPAANISGNGGDPTAPASTFASMWGNRFNIAQSGGTWKSGMSSYPSMGPNSSPTPVANGALASSAPWTPTGNPAAPSPIQQVATALSPAAPHMTQQSQQPNFAMQMGNQVAMARQQSIQQRAQQLMATLAKGTA